MRTSFNQKPDVSKSTGTSPSSNTMDAGLDDECPSGTVPIRRTTKEELVTAETQFREHFKGSFPVNADELAKLIVSYTY